MRQINLVDERLPLSRLVPLGLQHVLVMYAGAVAVPLIVGGALRLPKEQLAVLINADLFTCGVVTLIQSLGVWRFGIRLPVMMGVTFAAVGPMLALAANPDLGLAGIYGAGIGAGVFGMLIAPLISRLLPLFPPVVTGSIIAVIGISLMRVGVNWAAGGQPTVRTAAGVVANPDYGSLQNLAIALAVLVFILLVTRFARGFLANVSVLLGIVFGTLVSMALGRVSFSGLGEASWFALVRPFQLVLPRFDAVAIATMSVVMLVAMIESLGMFLALGNMTGRKLSGEDLARGLRADGLGTLLGGIFNTFPYTSFSQNVGLVGVTGVRSRWVCVTGGVILLGLGVLPKLAFVVASVPQYVLGGAGIVMFGMVCATGIRILGSVDYAKHQHSLLVVAISIGCGMIPLVAEHFFDHLPKALSPILHSGILLTTIVAVALNAFFTTRHDADRAVEEFVEASRKVGT
jgi:NCS2 family nucleobase:cation symporter-2